MFQTWTVDVEDRQFSHTEQGDAVLTYGHAGDCGGYTYGMEGTAEMNLTRTGFYFPGFTQVIIMYFKNIVQAACSILLKMLDMCFGSISGQENNI